MERSEESQMDHGGITSLSDRSTNSRQACRQREAELQGGDSLPERRFRPRFSRAVQTGAGGCRRRRQGDHGADLRSHRSDHRFPAYQSVQVCADVFYNISTGKASSQSIRKVAELGWKPLQLLSAGSTGRSILNAAGFENATGIVAIRYAKEVGVARWEKDPDVMAFEELRKKYLPNVDPDNTIAFAGYGQVATMAEILRRCGDELTRANVLKQATTLTGFHSPYFLDGITYSYTPDDYTPMKTL